MTATALQASTAFWYQCKSCTTYMHAPVKARMGEPYRCVLCRSFMTFLHVGPIPPEQAGRVTYNPGILADKGQAMTTDSPTQEAPAVPETALTTAPKALATPLPIFKGAEMAQALTAYRELQRALDQSMPEQVMELDGKPYRKKGYWRAIAVAFNLTVEPIDERREVNSRFEDGRENFGYVVTYRASTATGRSATGDGSCFAVEKARRFRCPHPHPTREGKTEHWPAENCPDFDPLFQWRSLPPQATEHNIRSHAHTRAYNRAVSNLVGFGEVSAEEVERDEGHEARPVGAGRTQAATDQRGAAHPTQTHHSTVSVISERQARRLFAIARDAGWQEEMLDAWLREVWHVRSIEEVPRNKYEAIVAEAQQGPKVFG